MKTSVCLTLFNEEKSVSKLIESLLQQTKKPDEVVIVDGGSSDKTIEIIRHYQKKDKRIKLLIQKCTRAKGRNLSIELAKGEIIITTDADCIATKDWLRNITDPFKRSEVNVVAGFYTMRSQNRFQKAESMFLGVLPKNFNINFLPSTRSMAFRKKIWEDVGGFPEREDNSAEDTDFNYKLIINGANFARAKNAVVEWGTPKTFKGFIRKIYTYAKWDSMYGAFWNPVKRFSSHNLKAISKLMIYLFGLFLLIYSFFLPTLFMLLIPLTFFYLLWAFKKAYSNFYDARVGMWGVILQISTDIAIILGFIVGKIRKTKNESI